MFDINFLEEKQGSKEEVIQKIVYVTEKIKLITVVGDLYLNYCNYTF